MQVHTPQIERLSKQTKIFLPLIHLFNVHSTSWYASSFMDVTHCRIQNCSFGMIQNFTPQFVANECAGLDYKLDDIIHPGLSENCVSP